MKFEDINPNKLNHVGNYVDALNYLIDLFNRVKVIQIGSVKDYRKKSIIAHSHIEILRLIYEILPIRTNIKSANVNNVGRIIEVNKKTCKDNLFNKYINLSFITNRLLSIHNEENEWFFFFNYLLRNANSHYKHKVDLIGYLSSPRGTEKIDLQIVFDRSSNTLDFIEKIAKKTDIFTNQFNHNISITTITTIEKASINREKSFEYWLECKIDMDFISNIIKKIKDAFVDGIMELKEYISSIDDDKLKRTYTHTKERYINVISTWQKSLEEID